MLLGGCVVPMADYAIPDWPVEKPDVVIIGFAGRCNPLRACKSPEQNRAYLSETPYPNTLGALQAEFEQLGYSALTFSFRSHFMVNEWGPGYLAAANVLERVKREWIDGQDDPTRLVLVAHSHGTQFMSLLAWDNPDLTFDYAIYLDAVCLTWDNAHRPWLQAVYGSVDAYPEPLPHTGGAACDSLEVPGLGLKDISDIVPWNVTYGVEVLSGGMFIPGLVADNDPNHRPDGSTGLATGLLGLKIGEQHLEVRSDRSAAINWVLQLIATNGLPDEPAHMIMPVVPEGFELATPPPG